MCGLIGMVGALEHKHKAVMLDLFYLNTLRGKDSTGLTAVGRDRGIATRKMTVPGYDFIELPIVRNAMADGDQLWMGHGRWKTVGDVSRRNAHPFEVLDEEGDVLLVGTHNGTLQNKWELERELKGKYDTDSEALFNWLVQAPDYKKAIGSLRGAWSLVWWNPLTNSLHFCRNKERPLVYARSKDGKVLFYASEAWMLINACVRNGVELAKNDAGISCHYTLEDHLYTLEIPQEKDALLPNIKREGGYTGEPVNNFLHKSYEKFQKFWPEHDEKDESKKKEEEKEGEADKGKAKVFSIADYKGYQGLPTSFDEIQKLKAKGCGWCKEPIKPDQPFAYMSEDALVCSKCLQGRKHSPLDEALPESLVG